MRINFIDFDDNKGKYDLNDILGIQLCIIKKDDTTKSIIHRVEACVDRYIEFFNKLSIPGEFNRTLIEYYIKRNKQIIIESIECFLRGDIINAIENFKLIWSSIKKRVVLTKDLSQKTLFRARNSDTLYLYQRDEMFHVPLNNREKVGNQRYSFSGLPCLYLGSTSYICWEELKRPNVFSCNFVGIDINDNNDDDKILDMCFVDGSKVVTNEDLSLIPLLLVCSLQSKQKSLFKPEYIITQLIMHILISERKYFGIRYFSSSLTMDNAYPFYSDQITATEDIWNHLCYAFPVKDIKGNFCEKLKKNFLISNPYSLNTDLISKSQKFLLIPENSDTFIPYYKYSVFRRLDDILNRFNKDIVSEESLMNSNAMLIKDGVTMHLGNNGDFSS